MREREKTLRKRKRKREREEGKENEIVNHRKFVTSLSCPDNLCVNSQTLFFVSFDPEGERSTFPKNRSNSKTTG